MLRAAVEKLPRDREIVLYCGCCPWDHCPKCEARHGPAARMGFTRAKAMYSATSFKTDWIDRGFPVVRARPGNMRGRSLGCSTYCSFPRASTFHTSSTRSPRTP